MTIQSGFFNSINGDRKYDATWFAQYFASFIGNGVFPNPSTGLQVVEDDNMNIVVKAGKGWINGYFVVNDSEYVLTLDNADGVLKRIDRIVMRLNYLTRQIEIDVKKGTFASNPVAPTLQRDVEQYELALADVLISNGATAITQTNITDTRFDSSLCGIVKGLIDEIDTTDLFAQYDDAFRDWFATIQDILDGDVAGNLANRINEIGDSLGEVEVQVNNHINGGFIYTRTVKRSIFSGTQISTPLKNGANPKYAIIKAYTQSSYSIGTTDGIVQSSLGNFSDKQLSKSESKCIIIGESASNYVTAQITFREDNYVVISWDNTNGQNFNQEVTLHFDFIYHDGGV